MSGKGKDDTSSRYHPPLGRLREGFVLHGQSEKQKLNNESYSIHSNMSLVETLERSRLGPRIVYRSSSLNVHPLLSSRSTVYSSSLSDLFSINLKSQYLIWRRFLRKGFYNEVGGWPDSFFA